MNLLSTAPINTRRPGRSGWWPLSLIRRVLVVACILLALAMPHPVKAETFHCGAGNVPCLIEAIHTANANGGANTVTLEAGTYTLAAIDDPISGANSLPAITSPLTIRGAGAGMTVLEREPHAPPFRLVNVAPSGTLTLEGLTLHGATEAPGGGGLIHIGGTVILTRSSLVDTATSIVGDLPPPDAGPPRQPHIMETDLIEPPLPSAPPQQLQAYLTLVQTALKREVALIQQPGLVEVTLTIRKDGAVTHTEIVQLEGPATLHSQLLPRLHRLGPLPPPPVEVDLLVVTVLLPSQYPGADLLDRFGPLR
jgi:hypothetical protein